MLCAGEGQGITVFAGAHSSKEQQPTAPSKAQDSSQGHGQASESEQQTDSDDVEEDSQDEAEAADADDSEVPSFASWLDENNDEQAGLRERQLSGSRVGPSHSSSQGAAEVDPGCPVVSTRDVLEAANVVRKHYRIKVSC